jgi:hypothetical protein
VYFNFGGNVRAKSCVSYCELNNFDETGFIMGVICPVTHVDGPEWPQGSDIRLLTSSLEILSSSMRADEREEALLQLSP